VTCSTPYGRCEEHGLRVVDDTNVWVSGLITPDSEPGSVVQAVRTSGVELVISWDLVAEITDVLRRPKLRRDYLIGEGHIESLLTLFAPFLPDVDVDVTLRDPDDAHVITAAIACSADVIVTGDRDLLEDGDLIDWLGARGVEVNTPAVFLDRLR
jgi:putative PIN family toxin of toxin-antitoxin system